MAFEMGVEENKKVTFSLPVTLIDQVRCLVQAGEAASQSALVKEALEKEIRARRTAQLRAEFSQAAADPDFLQDIEGTMRDFATADQETARTIP
jgi:Arc/MetJ-type ribon-helix-helix transcriptional regulator